MVDFQRGEEVNVREFQELLRSSGLGNRRPIDDLERLQIMLRHSNLIITARLDNNLIGIARSITDFAYCTYLSDLAVDQAYHNQGIGLELIRRTKSAVPDSKLILLAAPEAVDYYPRIGFHQNHHCYHIDKVEDLRG